MDIINGHLKDVVVVWSNVLHHKGDLEKTSYGRPFAKWKG